MPVFARRYNKILCFGTFDFLHPGHIYFLKQSKKNGKNLIVIVARDKTVKKLKGKFPRENERTRLKKIKALNLVDQAYLGHSFRPYFIVQKIKPDLICLGYDQKFYAQDLPQKIKELGLKTKIKRIGAYKSEKYKSSKLRSK